MTINLNANPYFDDFSEDKSFHQILFRPGYSVQARELTQLQSILRNQIAKFGGHVFKHGSVVIPGNSSSDLNVCYVKLSGTPNITTLVNKYIVNQTTGLRGLIKFGINAAINDLATLYVAYTNTGYYNGTISYIFSPGDTIKLENESTEFLIDNSVGSVGVAAMASIATGVFFVNGTFVTVPKQSIVISKYTNTPNCHVLLQIVESIIDSDIDTTLLDPAQGSYNYAAPGADRLKIDLVLTTLPLGSTISNNYIEIMRYKDGVLEEHLRYSKYNELEKNLARRTYDESGDYRVSGLGVTVREHLRSDLNGGRYYSTDTPSGNVDKMIYTVGAGKAYIRGFEVEVFSDRELTVNKARDDTHVKTTTANLVPSYGQYLYLGNVKNFPDFQKQETLTLYNTSNTTHRRIIGTAKALAADFHESNSTTNNILLKLFISDLALTAGNDISNIGHITWSDGSAHVLHRFVVQTINTIDFAIGDVISNNSVADNVNNIVINNSGSGYTSVPTVTISSAPAGGVTALAVATIAEGKVVGITVTNSGSGYTSVPTVTISSAPAGGVTALAVATTKFRTATTYKFNRATAELYVHKETSGNNIPEIGDNISHSTSGAAGRLVTIESLGKNENNNLIIQLPRTAVKTVNSTDMTYKVYYTKTVDINNGTGTLSINGDATIDPIEQGNFLAVVASSTDNTFITNVSLNPAGTAATITANATQVKVICAVTKTHPTPKTKSLTQENEQNLAPSNIIQLKHADGVRLISITSNTMGDVTDSYIFNGGQDDFVYARSSLKLKANKILPTGLLTVTYDYFSHSGTGDYFSINSYINSSMNDYESNPLLNYTSKNTGKTFDLRNCLDFRPRVAIDGTFSGTGASLGALVQNGSRITTSIDSYMGRIDTVILSKDGIASVITGIPSDIPQLPIIPKEVLYLAKIDVPPYTYSAGTINPQRQKNRGYTMNDVGALDARIRELENYVTLSQTENSIINYDVVDAKTGLSRYKSGYLVDTFSNPDTISDIFNPLFKVSYVSENIVPMFEVIDAVLTVTSNGGQVTGSVVTLPFTNDVLAKQPVSSKFTNINPFSVFSWGGSLTITPATDTWVEIENLSSIINNIDEVTEIIERTEFVEINRPWTNLVPEPIAITSEVIINPLPSKPIVIPTTVPLPLPIPASGANTGLNITENKPIINADDVDAAVFINDLNNRNISIDEYNRNNNLNWWDV